MRRVRMGLVVALAAAFLAACGTPPVADPAPAPPPPTAPVGADGQPITNLCQLLSVDDFAGLGIAGIATAAPTYPADPAATAADCVYGNGIEASIRILPGPTEAASELHTRAAALSSTQDGPMAGVDESVYGKDAKSDTVLLRRRRMVVEIALPAVPDGGQVKLIQLAALVLTRSRALGT